MASGFPLSETRDLCLVGNVGLKYQNQRIRGRMLLEIESSCGYRGRTSRNRQKCDAHSGRRRRTTCWWMRHRRRSADIGQLACFRFQKPEERNNSKVKAMFIPASLSADFLLRYSHLVQICCTAVRLSLLKFWSMRS